MSEELRFDITVYGNSAEIHTIKKSVEINENDSGYDRSYQVDEGDLDDGVKDLLISNLKFRDLVYVVRNITTSSWFDANMPFEDALELCIHMEPDPTLRGFLMAFFMDKKEVELAKEYCQLDSEGMINLGSLQQWIHDNPEHMLHSTIHGSGG